MTNDEIRSFLERFRDAWEAQDVKALVACYAEDCVVVSPLFILTLKDGLITKDLRIYDFTSMLIQLGVLRAKPAN